MQQKLLFLSAYYLISTIQHAGSLAASYKKYNNRTWTTCIAGGFQYIQKNPEDFLLWSRQDSTISLYQHYLTKRKKRERVLRLRNVLRRRQNTVLVGLAPNGGIGIRTLDPLIKSQML